MTDFGTPQFLTPEESALVDQALMTSSEKFLTRLTLSSWKLLKYIAEQEETAIEDLTVPQIIAWFERDAKLKMEHGPEAGFLKW